MMSKKTCSNCAYSSLKTERCMGCSDDYDLWEQGYQGLVGQLEATLAKKEAEIGRLQADALKETLFGTYEALQRLQKHFGETTVHGNTICGMVMTAIEQLEEKNKRIETLQKPLKEILESHVAICGLLDIPTSQPLDSWRSMKTRVEVVVEGKRLRCYGGAVFCTQCGFMVAGYGGKRCPKCEAKELGITMDQWYKREDRAAECALGHEYARQCNMPIACENCSHRLEKQNG